VTARNSQNLAGWRRAADKCVRGGDALKAYNRIKVAIETGNAWDPEMLSLQNDQSIMEIQATCMPIHQIKDSRK